MNGWERQSLMVARFDGSKAVHLSIRSHNWTIFRCNSGVTFSLDDADGINWKYPIVICMYTTTRCFFYTGRQLHGRMTIGKNKILESYSFRKWGKFYRADFWNRANEFPIYLCKADTAPDTICEPLSLEKGCFKSNFSKITFVEPIYGTAGLYRNDFNFDINPFRYKPAVPLYIGDSIFFQA